MVFVKIPRIIFYVLNFESMISYFLMLYFLHIFANNVQNYAVFHFVKKVYFLIFSWLNKGSPYD
jgi:hypothetical protein